MKDTLQRLARGEISVAEAERIIKALAIQKVGSLATLDTGREFRKGIPEIIIAEGKSPDDVVRIAKVMLYENGRALISRMDKQHLKVIKQADFGDVVFSENRQARVIVIKNREYAISQTGGKVGILTAGTSDIPLAEEAKIVAEEMGCEVVSCYDVGVAGIHRLFIPLSDMVKKDVDVIVVVAGREGAIASIVAGLVDIPIIAVPASMGYGFGGKGISALMSMLQACPLGLAVVNIDGGIPAGTIAALIANRVARFRGGGKHEVNCQ
ncbi:nickel pincer cofactor biosynthesis protein LarB [Chloroflexota bacterium]